ncbi:Allantoinase [Paenibacillus pasadenensis]|uniref:Allantoinase n=1 Tax=Paenibacillus pasadenensis TaxID=217090 RepID=A0A2N5NAT0_9BACL|nr:allantoinase AllB [Paenibacillus pasadenensis]PLT47459.1 Allantoinase [Paenibacillus pasadenensis]
MGEKTDLPAAGWTTVIKGGDIVLPDAAEPQRLDIAIAGGAIAAIGPELDAAGADIVDASGLLVLPGGVDVHVHFNEPNMGHWEGFPTGSAALAAGGVTAYADMPLNGLPATVDRAALALKASCAEGRSAVDYAFWGGLVPGKLEELEPLAEAGVVGFKAFVSKPGGEGEGRFVEADDWTLYEGMRRIASFGGVLALHAENDSMTTALGDSMRRAGRVGALDFAASRPPVAELEAVHRALFYAELTGCRLHFVHISHPDSVERIDRARRDGLDVTVETCPHYLMLTADDMARIGPVAKCAPPLRDAESVERLWAQLAEGKIDLVASDHSPSPIELKAGPGLSFFDAWGGISGAQSTVELVLGEGLRRGIPAGRLAQVLAGAPAERFGLTGKGGIAVGKDADLALIDRSAGYTLESGHLQYLHPNSPYTGMRMDVRVVRTLLRGQVVYSLDGGVVPAGGVRTAGGLGAPAERRQAAEAGTGGAFGGR